jgi:GrpB-like predicted nucleotidyltransferase (UPF0157 family)
VHASNFEESSIATAIDIAGRMSLPVRIADYNSSWPKLFEAEEKLILGVIGQIVVGIEHIGSTAVPGLGAKPIIDTLAAVHHLSHAKMRIEPLRMIGYEYEPGHEAQIPERRFFSKGRPPAQHYHLRARMPKSKKELGLSLTLYSKQKGSEQPELL